MKKKQTLFIYFSIILIVSILLYCFFYFEQNVNDSPLKCQKKPFFDQHSKNESDFIGTRDFYRYKCKTLKRIGGLDQFVKKAPDDTYR